MTAKRSSVLAEGLSFAESPRWRNGTFWFSDFHVGKVIRLGADGATEPVVEVPGEPSGLGWLPSGDLLVVSMQNRKLMRFDGEHLVEHADLSNIATWHCNDMVVDRAGRAYVGNFGAPFDPDKPPTPADIACVHPNGDVVNAAQGLLFPNGMAITDDGGTLLVAETRGDRISAFDVASDGTLANHTIWAELEGAPDGMCLDAEGMLWIALPMNGKVARISKGGEVHDEVTPSSDMPVSCMLGGDDLKQLYITTAINTSPEAMVRIRPSRIEVVSVDVPGTAPDDLNS